MSDGRSVTPATQSERGWIAGSDGPFDKVCAWFDRITLRSGRGSLLHLLDAQINRVIAMVGAKVAHPFRVIKHRFGHVNIRSRGLSKNRARIFTLFALGNLFLVRRKLLA